MLASAAFFCVGASLLATDVDAAMVCAAPGRDTIAASGIINSYWGGASATNGGSNAIIALGNQRTGTSNTPYGVSAVPSTGISAGDLLIVMQMQGPTAGAYEYVTAVAPAGPVTSGSITVRGAGSNGGLLHSYTQSYGSGSTFQVIRVPQTLNAALGNYTSAAWDVDASGYGTGGVFALDVAQQATLNGTVSVVGQGFRGGPGFNLASNDTAINSSTTAYPADSGTGGSKGEGTQGTPGYVFDGYGANIKKYGPNGLTNAAVSTAGSFAPSGGNDDGSYAAGSFGFGAMGNAGGGGNDAAPATGGNQYNSGGAGGGNAGRGGQGGWTWLGTAAYCTPVGFTPTQCPFNVNEGITDGGGRGGTAVGGLSAGMVTLGGGGGAASVNNNPDASTINTYPPIDIAVDPTTLSGGSTTVNNGAGGPISGSGGRGGGIVLLRAGTFNAGAGQILADGVRAYNQFGSTASEAAGGGGGGGAIVVLAQAASGTLQTSAVGGRGGDPDYYAHGPGGGGGGGYVLTNFSVGGSVDKGGSGYVPKVGTYPASFPFPNHYGTDAVDGIAGYMSQAGGTTPGTSSGSACSPDVAATVTLPGSAGVGASVNGSLNYLDNGPSDAVGVGYGATLPAGLGTVTFGTITLNGVAVAGASATYNNSSGAITYTGLPSTLPNTQSLVVPISFAMPANGTSVTATDVVSEAAADPVPSNNNGTATVNGTPQADDAVTITGLPASAAPSAAIFGVLNFINNGPSVSNGTAYSAKLPLGASVSSIKYNGTTLSGASATVGADGTVTFSGLPATLNSGDTVTVAFNATMPAGGGSSAATSTISSSTTDSNTSNNTATAIVTGQGTADLATTITGVPTSAQAAGSTFTGSVNFQNNGPNTADTPTYTVQVPPGSTISASQVQYNGTPINGVTVTIDQYGNVTFGGAGLPTSLANGDKVTIGFTSTMPSDGSNADVVSSISSPTTDPNTNNNNASTVVTGIREADLQSTVTGYATFAQTAGNTESGMITFADNGPSGATGVTYTSALSGTPTSVTLGTPTLNGVAISGATATYNSANGSISYTGLPTTLNSGDKITVAVSFPMPGNPVTVSSNITSNTSDPNTANNAGSQTLNGGNDLAVTLTNWKTAAQTSGTAETSTFTYSIVSGSAVSAANYTPVLTLTPGLTGVTITATNGATGSYNASTGAVTFGNLPNLMTGTGNIASEVFTINYTMPTTNVVAQASISETPNIDTYAANNSATATVPGGAAMTDMATTITGLGGVAAAGSMVTSGVINFTNAATNVASGTSFAAKLPLGATVTAITLNGTAIGGASATVGADGTVTFSGMPTSVAQSAVVAVAFSFPMPADGSAATATATITSSNDSNAANNKATATETGDAATDLQTKVTQPATAAPNVTLNGTLDYLNNGPNNAVNPTYQMTLPVAGGTPTITSVMLNGSLLSVTTSIAANGVVTFTGMPTTLTSGDDLRVAYSYQTPAAGSVSTTGQISYPGSDTVPGNNSATGTTTVTANAPTVMVTKTVDHTTHNAGDSVNWTLTVNNTGNSATSGVITLTDTLPSGITNVVITPSSGTTCSPANPTAGTTLTCSVPAGLAASTGTATVGIAATLPSAGTYNNSVTPSGNAADNPTCAANACSTITVVGSATMQVFKTSVHGTGTFGYTLTNMSATTDSITTSNQSTSTPGVINVVTSLSTPITLNESTSPAGYSITSASCVDTNSTATGNTGSFGTLSGSTLTIPVANIKQNSTLQCTFVNTITDTISIAKTGPTAMTAGSAYNYTLTVTNTSTTATVTSATVADQLPAGFTFNSGSGNGWTCSAVGQLVSCSFAGTIASRASSVITISATPTAAATGVINYATVDPTGGTAPATPAGCSASSSCALSPSATVTATGLSIAKSAPNPGLMPNTSSTYTLTVTNNGSTAATAATVKDQLPTQLVLVSAVGSGWACSNAGQLITCTYAGSIGAAGSGSNTSTIAVTVKPASQAVVGTSLTNYASIDPTGGTAPPTPAASCTPTTACASQTSTVGGPNIMVSKTVDQATHSQGDTITWTIKAANTGGSASAAAITLTDSLPAGVSNIVATPSAGTTCTPANPVAGGMLTCTVPAGLAASTGVATVTITATATTTGTITNTVTPSGSDNPTCASGACSASTMVGGQSITLQKALMGPRVSNTDQFTVQISTGATVLASATTTGSGNTVANGSTGATAVTAGSAYTLSEVAAGSTTLSSYASSLACSNATTGSTTTLPTTLGASVTPAAGDRITCTITNSSQPMVTLTKALGTARIKDSDEFTIQILQGATTLASATTTGSGSTLGSNTTGAVQTTTGTTYTLNEIAAAGSGTNLSSYSSSLACVNSTSGSSTVLPTTVGGSLTPASGDNITCTLTNSAAPVLATSISGLPGSAEPAASVAGVLNFTNTGIGTATGVVYSATLPTGLTGVVLGTPAVNGTAVTGATATYNSGTGAVTISGLPASEAQGAAGSVTVALTFTMPAANVTVTTRETSTNAATVNGTASVTEVPQTTLMTAPTGLPTVPTAPAATVNGSLTFNNTGANLALNAAYSATLSAGLSGVVLGTPTVNGTAVTGATASYNTGTGAITISGLPSTQAAGSTGNVAVPLQFVMPTSGTNVVASTQETADNAPTATGTATVTGEVPTTLTSAPTGLPTTAQAPAATINGSLTFNNTGTTTAYSPGYSATLPAGVTGVVLGTPTVNGVAVTGATASYNSASGAITISGLPATQVSGAAGNVAVPLQFVMPAAGTNVLVTTQETASNATTATGQATVTGETTTLAATPAGLPGTPQAPGATVNGALSFDNTGSNVAANPSYAATLPTGLAGVVLGTPTVNGVAITGATASYASGTGAITISGLPATQAAGSTGNVAVPLQFVMPSNGASVLVTTTETASNAPTATGQTTVNGEALTTLTTAPTGLPGAAVAPGSTVNGSLTFDNTGTSTAYSPVYSATLPTGLSGVVLGTPTVNGVAVTGATASYNSTTGAITLTGMPATQAAGAAGNVAVPLQFVMPAGGSNVVVGTQESAANAPTATGTATVTGETTTLATSPSVPIPAQAPGTTVTGALSFRNTGTSIADNPVYSGTLPSGLTGVVLGTPTVNGVAVTGASASYDAASGNITITGLPTTQAAGTAGNVAVSLQLVMPANGSNVTVHTTETASNATTATGQATITGEAPTTLTTAPTGLPTAAQAPGTTVNGSLTFNDTGTTPAYNPVYSGTLPTGLTGVVLGTPTINGVAVTGATASYTSSSGAITLTGMPTTQPAGATGNVAVSLQFVMPAAGGNVVVTTQETASNASTATGTATVNGETTTVSTTPGGLPSAAQAPGATVNGSLTYSNSGSNVAANPVYSGSLPSGLTGVVLGTPTLNGVAVTGAVASYYAGTGAITITGMPSTQPAGAAGNIAVSLQFVMPSSGTSVVVNTSESASNAPTATGQATVAGQSLATVASAPTGFPGAAQAPGSTVNGALTYSNTGATLAYSPVYGGTLPTGLTGVVLGTPTLNGVAVTGATASYNGTTGAITLAGLPTTQAAGAAGNVAVSLQFVMPASGANVIVNTSESASNAATATGQTTVTGQTTTVVAAPAGLPTAAQAPGATVSGSLTFDNTGSVIATNPVYSATLATGLTGVVLGTPTVNGVAVTGATASYSSASGAITITGLPASQAAGSTGNVAVALQFVMPSNGSNVLVTTTEAASDATTATGQATVTGEALTALSTAPTGLPTAAQAPGSTVNGALSFSNTGAATAYNPVYSATLPTGLSGVVLGTPTVNGVAVTGATATYNTSTGAVTLTGMPTTQAAGAAGNVAVPLQFVMPAAGGNVLVTTTESASNATTATGQATVTGETTTLTTAPSGLPATPQAPGSTVNGSLTYSDNGANLAANPVYGATLPAALSGVVLGTPTINGAAVTGAVASYNSASGAVTVTGMPATQAAGAAGNVAITLQFVMPSAGSNVVVSTSESASNAPIATGTATVSGEVPTTVASAPTGLPTTQQAPGATVNGALTFSDSGASTAYNPMYSGTLPSGLTGVVLGTPTINGVAVTGATASYVSATGAITLAGMPTTQAAGAAGNVAVSLQFVMPASGANLLVTTTESASNAATATGQATVSGEPLTALTAAPAGLPTTPQAPGATVNGALTFDNTGSAIADNPVYSAALPAGLTGVVLGTPTVNGVAVSGAVATYNSATGAITVTGMPTSQPPGSTGNVAITLQFAMPSNGTNVIVHATESASNASTATGQSSVTGEPLTTLTAAPSGLPTTPQAPGASVNGSLTFDNTGGATAFNPVYSASLPTGLTGVVLGTPTVNGAAVTGATATYNSGSGAITIAGLPATQAAGTSGNVAVPLQFVMPVNGSNVVVNTTESASNAPTATGQATVTGQALTTLTTAASGLPTTQQAPGASVNGSLTFSNSGASTAFNPVYGGTLPTGLTGVVLGTPTVNGVAVTGASANYNPTTGAITLTGMPATQASGAAGNVAVPLQFVMPATGSNVVISTSESASNAPTASASATVNGEALTTLSTAPIGLPTTQQSPGATVSGSLTFHNSGTSPAFNPVYGATLPANLTGVVLGTPAVNGVAVTGASATYAPGTGAITIIGLPATQAASAAGDVAVPLQFAMPSNGNNVLVNTTESASNAATATGAASVNGEALTTLATTTTGLPTVAQAPGTIVNGALTFNDTGASTAFNPVYSASLPSGLTGVVLGTPTINGVAVSGATASYNSGTGIITISGMPATQVSGAAGNVAVPLQFVMPSGGASVNVATQESANNAPTANGTVTVPGVPQTSLTATVSGFPTTVQQPNTPVSGFINFTNNGANPASNPVFSATLPAGVAGVVLGTPTLNGVPIAGATATYNPTSGAITLTGTPTTLAPGAVLSVPLNFNMPASGANVPITAQVTASNAPTANGISSVPGNAVADLAIQTSAPATVAPDGSLVYTLTITNNGPAAANNASFSDVLPAALGVPTASCAPNSVGVTCGATVVNGKTVTGTIASLPAGGSAIITITTTAPASGSVTNTATVAAPAGVTDPVVNNNSSSAITTVGAVGNNVDLSVTTSGTSTVQVNGAVTYVVDVVNGGPAAANNAVFNYSTAGVVTGVTWTCQAVGGGALCPAASGTGNSINQTIATFPDGGHLVYTIHGTAPANAQQYVDTATITAPSGTVETNAVNNSATSTTNVTNAAATSADVAVSLNGPTTVQPSAPVVYTVVVDNNGPASGNGTTLSAPVPAVVTNVTTTCTASGGAVCPSVAAGNNINAVIPTLPMGGELTFTITGTAPTSGTFSESATVTPATGTNDPVPSNNTAGPVVTTVPVLSADLSIQKNGPDQVLAGAVINYTIVVSNAGPNAGDGASVTDVLPAGLSNASVVCSAATGGAACGTAAITAGTLHAVAGALPVAGSITLTVSAKAPASGTLSNSASVAPPAGVSDPNMANNSSGPVQTTIVSSIATQADLSAAISGPSLVAPNGTVTYVVTITNAGPAAGNGALISDVLPTVLTNISAVCGNTIGGATCGAVAVNGKTVSSSIGTLPVGASLTLTITATAPASGTFSNSASVGAAPGETDPNTANNVAGPVVTSIGTTTGSANLGISKTGPDMAGAGSSFSYTLLVSNAGPAAANGALVSDAVPAGLTNIHATCSAPTNGALCGAVQVSGQNVTSAVQALPALGTVTITVTVTAPVPSGLQPTTVVNRATITPPAGINDPDTSDNVSNAVETSIVSAGVSGTVWLDINHDKKLDAGDPLLAHWIVELFHNGVLVATTTTNAQGQYGFSGVAPGPGYSLDFRDPGSKAIYGTPTNGNEGVPNPDSNAVIGNGIIQSLTLKPGINIVQQSLPVDPSGVVYDATVRTPVGGATVTLVGPAGFNPATELVGGAGNVTQITESSGPTAGAYQFLLISPGQPGGAPAGTYSIVVTAPAGYLPTPAKSGGVSPPGSSFSVPGPVSATTPIQPQQGPPKVGDNGRGTIYYFNLVFNPGSGAVINNNVPLDRISGGALTVQKTGSTTTADIGETVLYTVDVTSSVGLLPNVTLNDHLPRGFTLIPGTITINGVKAADPKASSDGALSFALGSIAASATVEVKYRVRVGVGAQQGDGINRAQASNPLGASSNVATFKVDVNGGVFTTNGGVVGKVFIDCNDNQIQDDNEIGIPGVRLYFSDGTFVVTDSEGKFSYFGLRPTTHTLKVDKTTLPAGSHLVESSNRNALDPNSLFIDLKSGELQQADFIEGSCSPQVMEETKARRGQGEVNAAQQKQSAAPALIFDSKPLNTNTPAAKPTTNNAPAGVAP